MPTTSERRVDLDWIRIGAFGLLILYHCGMFYTTWDWHVKSPVRSTVLDLVMLLSNPWRLALLFLVSGAATRFMTARLSPGRLARTRSARLLIPLAFGMLVIVPPQAYYEVAEKLGYADGFLAFYGRYLAFDQSFCPGRSCLILPTWNHLWFLPYLWAYTMLAAALLATMPGAIGWLERGLARLFTGPGLFLAPIAVLAAARVTLLPLFGSTHALVDDWYNHAIFLPLFVLGFALARAPWFWARAERARWLALGLGLAAYAAIATGYALIPRSVPQDDSLRVLIRVVYGADQWCWIVAILGFGRRWLANSDGPVRRYLTDAIFPYYIVHQTVIVVLAYHLAPLGLPVTAEIALILAGTAVACIATYEIARRFMVLRPLFGLRPVTNAKSAAKPGLRTSTQA